MQLLLRTRSVLLANVKRKLTGRWKVKNNFPLNVIYLYLNGIAGAEIQSLH